VVFWGNYSVKKKPGVSEANVMARFHWLEKYPVFSTLYSMVLLGIRL